MGRSICVRLYLLTFYSSYCDYHFGSMDTHPWQGPDQLVKIVSGAGFLQQNSTCELPFTIIALCICFC